MTGLSSASSRAGFPRARQFALAKAAPRVAFTRAINKHIRGPSTDMVISDRHDALDVTEGEIRVGLIGSKLATGSQAATRRRIRHDGHFAL